MRERESSNGKGMAKEESERISKVPFDERVEGVRGVTKR